MWKAQLCHYVVTLARSSMHQVQEEPNRFAGFGEDRLGMLFSRPVFSALIAASISSRMLSSLLDGGCYAGLGKV